MKKIVAALLLVCMAVCLCACGGSENEETQGTAPSITLPQVTEPEKTEPQGVTYTVKVVDEGGNPVAGAMVQLCAVSCLPKITDAQGVAVYENMEERSDYKASVTMYPEGYEQLGDIVDHYLDGATEVTITVKAVA